MNLLKESVRDLVSFLLEDENAKKYKNPKTGRSVGYARAVQLGLVNNTGTDKSTDDKKSENPVSKEEPKNISPKAEKKSDPALDLFLQKGKTMDRNKKIKIGEKLQKLAQDKESELEKNFNYSKEENNSLREYKTSLFKGVNKFLRGQTDKPSKDTEKIIAGLDKVMEKSTLPSDTTVFRGVRGLDLNNFKPGSSFEEKAYSSTSLDPNTANNFMDHGDYMMKIDLPKGSKGALVPSTTDSAGNKSSEFEVLLPRNQKYKVKSIDPKTKMITVELDND